MLDEIITDILKAEGWDKYTNDPADRGGPTKWGITLKAWQDFHPARAVTAEHVKEITEADARDFYERAYIVEPRFNELPFLLVPLVVDCGVNHGTSRAAKWVQQAVGTTADGKIGGHTLSAAKQVDPTSAYLKICAARVRFYGKIVNKDRTQARFIEGWNNRAAKWLDRLAERGP